MNAQSAISPVLEAALAYAARGWPVFPCKAANKRPLTTNGFLDATTDADVIRTWWRRWPDAMVACPTGPAVDAFVLDIDDPATFEAAAAAIDLALPATARSDTGKGYHLWFVWDVDQPVHNAQRSAKGWPFPELPGAEVRGDGGYVILPPSRHPSGRFYSWSRQEEPSDAPEDLLAIITRSAAAAPVAEEERPARPLAAIIDGEDTRYGLAALNAECDAIRTASDGAQEKTLNDGALRMGGLVSGGELSKRTATAQLIAAGLSMQSTNPNDPWTPAAIAGKVERGLRDGMAKPRAADRAPVGNERPAPSGETARLAARGEAYGAVIDGAPLPIERFADITPQLTGLWLVKRLLPAQGLVLIYGHPGSGKSFLALDLAFHVALGWPWQGRRVNPGLVIYVGAEGLSGLRNRISAFRRENEIEAADFALIPTPIDMQAPDADVERLASAIRAEAAHFGTDPALVVIDTLSKTFGAGKENTDDMATYVANCGRIAAEFACCVMPVHHRPKDAESEEPRGHSSLKGGVDTVILVEAGETKKARVTKQKDGELGEAILFNLKIVELGQDEDGEPVTSCIVQPSLVDMTPARDPVALAIARLPDSGKLALRQLDEVTASAGILPPDSIPNSEINRLRVGKVVRLNDWRDKALNAAGTDRDSERDTAKRSFNRALQRLQKDAIVRVWGEYAWREWAPAGQTGTSQSGHPRDKGTTGTKVLETCPVVPPRQNNGEQNFSRVIFPAPDPRDAMILAPGESPDDVVPGFE